MALKMSIMHPTRMRKRLSAIRNPILVSTKFSMNSRIFIGNQRIHQIIGEGEGRSQNDHDAPHHLHAFFHDLGQVSHAN